MTKTKSIPQVKEEVVQEQVDPRTNNQGSPKKQLIGYETAFLESLIQYLNTKPHGEVRGFIDAIQNGQAIEIKPNSPTP